MSSSEAEHRARELLDQHLNASEREMVSHGYLQFKGHSKGWYCIHWNSYRTELYTLRRAWRGQWRGKLRHCRSVCCTVGGYQLPIADQVLALKLCLQSKDERRLWRKATKSFTDPIVHSPGCASASSSLMLR